jgi:hypothetical protein
MATVVQADGVRSVVALEDGALVTGTVQDCTPILEHTQSLHNEGLHGSSELKHAAKLPVVLVERYCNLNGITFADFMQGKEHIRRMLNDPDLSGFRIWPGRV